MRIRSIRPEFWTSEDIARLDWHTRLVYIGLWSYVDDNGVGRDVERLITADLFPLDDDLSEASLRVHGALKLLEAGGQIVRYKVDGKSYLHIAAWDKHQKINRPSGTRFPLPTCGNAEPSDGLSEPSVSPHADCTVGEGEKGRRGEGEKNTHVEFPGTSLALVPQASPPASDGTTDRVRPIFEAWQQATGHHRAKLDPKRRRVINAALKLGYPPDDLIDAVRGWRHSPHHTGRNASRTVYDDIGLLLRDATHIEKFRDLERGQQPQPARPQPRNFENIQRVMQARQAEG